jgi:hypothetical protein
MEHGDENYKARLDFDLSEPLGPWDTGVGSDFADLEDWERSLSGMAM